MMNGLEAWGRLLDTFFEKENRAKVEWAIGAVLAGGPKKILTITGPAASGKSTVLKLAQRVFEECREESSLPVAIRHDGLQKKDLKPDPFVRAETGDGEVFVLAATVDSVPFPSTYQNDIERWIEARTTGNTFIQDRYYALVAMVGDEIGSVALHCLRTYRELGVDHYDNSVEGR